VDFETLFFSEVEYWVVRILRSVLVATKVFGDINKFEIEKMKFHSFDDQVFGDKVKQKFLVFISLIVDL